MRRLPKGAKKEETSQEASGGYNAMVTRRPMPLAQRVAAVQPPRDRRETALLTGDEVPMHSRSRVTAVQPPRDRVPPPRYRRATAAASRR